MKKLITILYLTIICNYTFSQVKFETDLLQQGKEISTELIGVFFEDINYAADGGLYAELIQNRSFEYFTVPNYVKLGALHAWSVIKPEGTEVSMKIENTQPLNQNNKNYLKVTISKTGSFAGIRNTGFDGIPVKTGNSYLYSVYIRSESKFKSPVILKIQSAEGNVLGEATINNITTQWTKFSGEIKCSATSDSANLVLVTKGKGTICFDMVSLFPKETFKNRVNGLRKELAQTVADLKPKFLRFPGGCISHGRGLNNAYRWKETIGDVAQRKPNWNTWGYHQTYGLGFYEYFLYCEDIGAMPLPVIPVGVSCQFRDREIAPLDQMKPWIDDALDLVEFANGAASTKWGKIRAEMGHPAPFNLKYLCLGNEEDDIPEFRVRFKMIADSLRKYHPEINIIGTSGTTHSGNYYNSLWDYSKKEKLAAVDEHYYVDPSWLLANNHRYDKFNRNDPKVFIGEWASWGDRLENAIAEAAYLTAVERNGDVIQFTCYAPLFCHEKHNQWNPDLIRFDKTKISKTANYYVQQIFSLYSGNKYLASNISYTKNFNLNSTIFNGKIGVGSWNTQVQYDDIKVMSGDKILLNEDFSSNVQNWEVQKGNFAVVDGVYQQNSSEQPAGSINSTVIESPEYTFSLRAKKTGGVEGFLIPFGFKNSKDFYWLNIGGWNNTKHAIEKGNETGKGTVITALGSIETNVWYNIKIEVNKSIAKVYLNDKLLFETPAPADPITASVVKNEATNQVIMKIVNSANVEVDVNMNIKGETLNQNVKVLTLQGNPKDRNTLVTPELIKPTESNLQISNQFDVKMPANSIKVFVFDLKK